VLFALVLVVSSSCTSTNVKKQKQSVSVQEYENEAQTLLDLVVTARVHPHLRSEYMRSIAYESERLMHMGVSIVERYVEKDQRCADYIEAALQLPEQLDDLSLREIEWGFQADERLKSFAGSRIPECQRAKTLLVYPAAVLVLAGLESTSTKDFDRMSDDINEVIAHSRSLTM
jgi:hypothetical protein